MMNSQNNVDNSSSSSLFNAPLSIDFIRRLKRPSSIPNTLEYTSGSSFQGSHLEDWIMQTLDEYLQNCNGSAQKQPETLLKTINKQVKDGLEKSSHFLRSGSIMTNESDDVVEEQMVISYQVNKSDHSLPGTQQITPSQSITNSSTSIHMEDDPNDQSKQKLLSDSYKKAMQSQDLAEGITMIAKSAVPTPQTEASGINNVLLASKRQEAKFYIQQILTDLITLGVLEYESGFENAINKTFKVGC